MQQKRVLITGVAGFIGFHLAQFLQAHGTSVFGIDSFTSYYDVSLKQARANILQNSSIVIANQDVRDKTTLIKLLEEKQITHIIHLAAQAGVRYSLQDPESYIDANISGFLAVLEALRTMPHIRLIYASSSSVYGDNKKIPFSEIDTTDSPSNIYGVTKKCNELMAYSYHQLFNIQSVGLRFFTVYGPWGRPDMAYFLFTKKILNNEPIELFGNGQMSRDFTYIDDIVYGIVQTLDKQTQYACYNLGNSHPEKIEDLVLYIEKYTGKKAKVIYKPKPIGEVYSTFADINRAKQELSFIPQTSLDQGMQRFIDWYTNYYHIK